MIIRMMALCAFIAEKRMWSIRLKHARTNLQFLFSTISFKNARFQTRTFVFFKHG